MDKIIKVESVVDTREYEEGPDGKMHPVSGSGQERECDRCGKWHVIHATVVLENGSKAVVGTGCASRESMEIQAALRYGASAAKRLAALRAELATQEKLTDEALAIEAEAAKLPTPPVEVEHGKQGRHTILRMGDAEVYSYEGDTRERRECLVDHWRSNRAHEMGVKGTHHLARAHMRYTREAIKKIEKRFADKTR